MTTCLCLRNMDGVHFVIFFILSLLLVAGLHFIFVLHATSIVFRTMAPNAVNTTSSLTVDGWPPHFRRVQRFSAPQKSYPFSPYVKVFSYFLHAHANMDNPGAKVAKRGPEPETLVSRFSLTLSFLSSQNETRSSACGKSRSRSGSIRYVRSLVESTNYAFRLYVLFVPCSPVVATKLKRSIHFQGFAWPAWMIVW